MTTPEMNIEAEDQRVYCHRRNCPGSTGLRCYQTDVPICMQCAIQTPVGYISKDAQRERQKVYFNIQTKDYILLALVGFFTTLFIGYPVVLLVSGLGFIGFFIMAFVGSAIGGSIGEASFRAIGRRRGRYTDRVLIGAMVSACLIIFLFSGLYVVIGLGIFAFTAIGAAVARIRITL